jgi:hypothetical protein
MNSQKDTELADRLTERMHALADRVDPSDVPPEADLARGRRRQRSGRIGAAAVALAVGAVIGGTGYLVHDARTGHAVVGPASSGSNLQHSGQTAHQETAKKALKQVEKRMRVTAKGRLTFDPRLKAFRAAIASVLDPEGRHLDAKVSNEQSGSGVLGTKLGWKEGAGLGEIMVSVATPGADDGGFSPYFSPRTCAPVAGRACTTVVLPDGTTGQEQHAPGELAVYYTRPDGQIVLLVASTLFGNNSTVSIGALPATARQLLRVASDPRLTLKQ